MIDLGFVDKLKTKFHRRSIDEEIDSAFDDSNAYSKKVLESSGEQLSSTYRQEAQPKPSAPLVEPGIQDTDPFAERQAASNQQAPELIDPLVLPKAMDRKPPRSDEPLQVPREHISTNDERKEFFGQASPAGKGSTASSPDVNRILLEIKDLRTQNEHILDLLKNIQDRMRGY